MKVIFNKDVPRVGKKFETKEVSDGYATNFLLPRNLAVKATPQEIAKLEIHKADMTKKSAEAEAELVKNLKKISEVTLEIKESANEKGHLFKGITKEVLVAELKKKHSIDLNASYVELEKPIKEVGEHKVTVRVGDNNGFFTVNVMGE